MILILIKYQLIIQPFYLRFEPSLRRCSKPSIQSGRIWIEGFCFTSNRFRGISINPGEIFVRIDSSSASYMAWVRTLVCDHSALL